MLCYHKAEVKVSSELPSTQPSWVAKTQKKYLHFLPRALTQQHNNNNPTLGWLFIFKIKLYFVVPWLTFDHLAI